MERIAKHAAALAMVVAVAASAPPAARAADLPSVLTEYSVASWGQKDGFPLGNTWSIVQDEDGYLWLGTDTGLFRFDGVRFVPWIAPQVEPPLRGSVRSLLVARDDGYVVMPGALTRTAAPSGNTSWCHGSPTSTLSTTPSRTSTS